MRNYSLPPRSLLVIVGLALLLRLIAAVVLPAGITDDSSWYMDRGKLLITNTATNAEYITVGPMYAFLAGGSNALLGHDNAILFLRILQAFLGAAVCAFVWRMAYHLTDDIRVATLASLGIAINPIFILDSNSVVTEPLFVFLLTWALSIYIGRTIGDNRQLAASGALLALASLTRAMSLLFPVGLVIHLALVLPWKQALRGAAILLVVYVLVLSTWTVYNLVKFNRFFVGASGAGDLLFAGTVGYNGTQSVDANYAKVNGGKVPSGQARDNAALGAVGSTIASNPVGYLAGQAKKLASALLQPHQTTYFPGPSLKSMAGQWLRTDRSITGLAALLGDPTFWPKFVLYIFHFLALGFGLIGIVLTLPQWRKFAPLTGFMVYTLLMFFFLLVVPRYLFPMMPFLWIFAAVGMVKVWGWFRNRKRVEPTSTRVQNSIESDTVPTT